MVAIQLYGISCSYLFNKRDAQSMFKQQFLQNDSILSLTVQVDGEVFRVDPTLHALYTTTVYSRQLKFSSVQFFFFEFSLIQNFSQGFRQSPGIRITENRLQIKNMLWSVSCLKGSYSIVLELWRQNNGVQIGVGVYAGLLQQLYIDNQHFFKKIQINKIKNQKIKILKKIKGCNRNKRVLIIGPVLQFLISIIWSAKTLFFCFLTNFNNFGPIQLGIKNLTQNFRAIQICYFSIYFKVAKIRKTSFYQKSRKFSQLQRLTLSLEQQKKYTQKFDFVDTNCRYFFSKQQIWSFQSKNLSEITISKKFLLIQNRKYIQVFLLQIILLYYNTYKQCYIYCTIILLIVV
eukprot:TRINITY_DN9757_c0_g1_i1.p1 TRINITY_DN9757_c0_g1~~TRINITY_DN9757_c0_g1_i1.p1  ORF type:complete len:346 (-),score=-23.96 TRINITY_DN9757_c0_g1_i1:478-1515(-)